MVDNAASSTRFAQARREGRRRDDLARFASLVFPGVVGVPLQPPGHLACKNFTLATHEATAQHDSRTRVSPREALCSRAVISRRRAHCKAKFKPAGKEGIRARLADGLAAGVNDVVSTFDPPIGAE
jgi:hypothetical protein